MFSIKRFKVVKDLILSKLDDVLSKVNSISNLLEKLAELTQASLRTDNSLLRSTIHLIDYQQTTLVKKLAEYHSHNQKQFNKLADLSQQFKVFRQKVDEFSRSQAEEYRKTEKKAKSQAEQYRRLEEFSRSQTEQYQKIEEFSKSQIEQYRQLIQTMKQSIEESAKVHSSILDQMDKRGLEVKALEQRIQLLHDAIEDNRKDRLSIQGGQVVVEIDDYSTINPEVGLMVYLYPYLPGRKVVDIGANVGHVSKCLLDAGYEVYAFEPYSPAFDKMKTALSHRSNFHPYRLAIGASDTSLELFVVKELTHERAGEDPSLYNTFRKHPLVEGLEFAQAVNVPVRSLESLHYSAEIPHDIGIVKIDTEGFDTEVIRGMGEFKYPVVITEFWDKNYVFGCEEGHSVADIVQLMQERNYHWYIVIHRQGMDDAAFFCNHPISVEKSWGNIFFFQHYHLFMNAMKWCSATLPTTYFSSSK